MPRAAQRPELPNLETTLNGLTVDYLKWYAAALGISGVTRKPDLVHQVQRQLTFGDVLRSLLARMEPGQRDVVAEVVHSLDGVYNGVRLAAKYAGVRSPNHPDPYYTMAYGGGIVFGRRADRKQEAEPFDVLFFRLGYGAGPFIPTDLAARLRDIVPPPPPATIATSDEPPTPRKYHRGLPEVWISDTERAAAHDLQATVLAVQAGKLSVSATTGLPSLASVRELRLRLQLDDYFEDEYARADEAIRPLALIMLVQAAKWAVPGGSAGKLELTRAGQEVLAGGAAPMHIRDAWERWLKTDVLDELSRVRGVRGQQAKGVRLSKPSERRAAVAAALRACAPGRWVSMRDFTRYLIATGTMPQVERGEARLSVGSSSNTYGWPGTARSYLELVPGSFVRAMLFEYAATLGMIELAYTAPDASQYDLDANEDYWVDDPLSPYDGLVGFMITALGAYALGLADTYRPPAPVADDGPPPLRVLPNLDVVVAHPERLTPNDRATLERIGTPQSEGVFRLDRALLTDAAEQGLGVEQLRTFLAGRSGTAEAELPQTVRVFLEDADRKLSALRDLGRVVLIEAGDPILVTQLANHPSLRSAVRPATIGDRAALLVPEDQEAAVRRALKKLGYVPRKGG